jgi:hypothetical protein
VSIEFWSLFGWWVFVGFCEYITLVLFAFIGFPLGEKYFGLGGVIVAGNIIYVLLFALPIAWLIYGGYLIGTQF